MIWIEDHQPLPPTHLALGPDSDAPGLLAVGGSVTPARLEEAYASGVFPWFSPGQPPLWWSPDPRMVLPVSEFRVSRSLRKAIRRFADDPRCAIRVDSAFRQVIEACASVPREGQHGTWIVPEIIDAYDSWHHAGRAHSFEVWAGGELVGGLYGVNLGRMFFGESMFSHRSDASKIALAALVAFCRAESIPLIDCQQATAHLASFGAREWPRRDFEDHVLRMRGATPPRHWTYHPGLWAQLGIEAGAPAAAPRRT